MAPAAGLEMDCFSVLQLLAVLVGLDTDDLMLQVVLQDGGDLTLLML